MRPPADGDRIVDQFDRVFDYVRIAVNERCNLRCVYCMPEEGVPFLPREKLVGTSEIIRIVRILSQLGVRKVRFTGGEPLLNNDIERLVFEASRTPGIETVHLTTNGLFLKDKAELLRRAGLDGINISLDTLDHHKYIKITRRQGLNRVLEALMVALALPLKSVKLNVVTMRDFNHDEIGDFVELTKEHRLTVRFIELMPFDAHQIWKTGKFLSAEKMLDILTELYPDLQPGKGSSTEYNVFRIPGYRGKFAVIPSFTRSLCEGCTRIRVTADGKIRNCLYSDNEFNLRDLMRRGAADTEIRTLFRQAMWVKSEDGWEAQHQGDNHRESMTQIGG